ncbi:HTH-type transcriptional regulator YiaJ [Dickeya solani]|nr:HTH-type transcriptional regulator YiaJ [Dickeya solani]
MNERSIDDEGKAEKPLGSQSLFRGLQLIEILSDYPNGCPLARIAELSGMNKSTVHRLLQGLAGCGYVAPARQPGSYRLTTKFIAIGQKALSSLNVLHVAAPHLEELNLTVGETVNFSTREDDHAILIYKLEPTTGMMRTRAYIGQHMSLHSSAMGKIFMAYGADDYPAEYWHTHRDCIRPLTDNTIIELPGMERELAEIRRQGWQWIGKRMNWAFAAFPRRCLIFSTGWFMPFPFRCRWRVCSRSVLTRWSRRCRKPPGTFPTSWALRRRRKRLRSVFIRLRHT